MTFAAPPFRHLRTLTDDGGLYEHAELAVPRPEHGYCVDDVARALVVCCRSTGQGGVQADLVEHYLGFVLAAQRPGGAVVNRRGADLAWNGEASFDDCWGRALWGLGAVVAAPVPGELRERALAGFEGGAAGSSPWLRASVFAGLGAAYVLTVRPGHVDARRVLADAAARIGPTGADPAWPWPEPRLAYANGALPEVLLAAGQHLGQPESTARGLALLEWLLGMETGDGHLSLTPVGGRAADGLQVRGDQQPIEAAALADACARAFAMTGDPQWAQAVALCASWFFGANDAGVSLYDAVSGGGCDGLEAAGRNDNQGAESTIALISTLQQARRLALQRA